MSRSSLIPVESTPIYRLPGAPRTGAIGHRRRRPARALAPLFGCALLSAALAAAAAPLSVFVGVLPLVTFVEAVGGERVAVRPMVLAGRSPATYDPSPKQIAALADADLYVRVGVPFETAWMKRIQAANPDMAVLDLRDDLPLRRLEPAEGPSTGSAEAYGLTRIPVEREGKARGARRLGALIDQARAAGTRVVLVQPQFDRRTAERVAREIGGRVETVDPLAGLCRESATRGRADRCGERRGGGCRCVRGRHAGNACA